MRTHGREASNIPRGFPEEGEQDEEGKEERKDGDAGDEAHREEDGRGEVRRDEGRGEEEPETHLERGREHRARERPGQGLPHDPGSLGPFPPSPPEGRAAPEVRAGLYPRRGGGTL